MTFPELIDLFRFPVDRMCTSPRDELVSQILTAAWSEALRWATEGGSVQLPSGLNPSSILSADDRFYWLAAVRQTGLTDQGLSVVFAAVEAELIKGTVVELAWPGRITYVDGAAWVVPDQLI
ncbi:hypothetical protein LCGC14_0850470 [marine sediment metagenome]|uniref:Uncharacterized protein n=1 Tax=marine sediment metagenome TaxID=412755 RepID=A0A0F9PFB8_9ZZZZ